MIRREWRQVLGSARLVLELLCIVAACELAVMLLLPWLAPGVHGWQEAVLDATLLAILVAPLVAWRAHGLALKNKALTTVHGAGAHARSALLSAGVLATGASLTLFLVWGVRTQTHHAAQSRFDHVVLRISDHVIDRFGYVADALREVQGASTLVGQPLDRDALRTWMGTRPPLAATTSAWALSVIRPLQRSQLPAYDAHLRALGRSDVAVRAPGSADDVYIVDAIEPEQANRQALGFDLGSEPVRREALRRAVDTGAPALTGLITLVQDRQPRPALLYFLPVYRPGAPRETVAQRRAALVALVSAPIRVGDLLQDLDPTLKAQSRHALYAVQADGREVLLASSQPEEAAPGEPSTPLFEAVHALQVGGQTLRLHVTSSPQFDADSGLAMPVWLGLLGGLLSVVAAIGVWLMHTWRVRAEQMARAMTDDLRQAQRKTDQALRENAALVSTLNRFGMVCITNPAAEIIDVNDALCEVSGYSRDELLGQNPRLLGSSEHEPFFWIAIWQTLLHGLPWIGEVCNRTKAGELYWVQAVIAPIMDGDGAVERYISIAYDVTASRQAQDELVANAERYNLAIDGGSDGLWDWMNVHAQEEWWSPQFYRLLGYEPGEIEANLVTFDAMLHPDDQKPTFQAIEQAFRDHRPFDVEYRLRTKSGQYRWFRSRAKVYFDDFGAATRMAGSIQDVHERKQAQAQLKEHSQQMAAIFSLSPDAFVSFDTERRVSYVSPSWTQLTGMVSVGLVGLDEQAFSERLFERAVPGQAVSSLSSLRAQTPDEQPAEDLSDAGRVVIEMKPPARRMLEMRVSRGQGGTVSQVLHLRDVTHETEVDQMKSAFLSMAAHELRTPMASIYGFTELLLTRELKQDKQRDLLGRIYRQSEAMAAIINELLDLARIEARQGKDFSFDACDLQSVVSEVIRDFKLPQDRAAPITEFPDASVLVWVDRQKLQQATLNVLSNAYKYSPQGGDVHVRIVERTMHGKAHVGLEIEDHGIGLTPEQAARVGERFFRADKSGNIPGTGLGVTIVKEIMELMGGSVTLVSEVGQGSVFTLWLPLMDISPSQFGALDESPPAAVGLTSA
jgi:PAS domain S-box-containing protein